MSKKYMLLPVIVVIFSIYNNTQGMVARRLPPELTRRGYALEPGERFMWKYKARPIEGDPKRVVKIIPAEYFVEGGQPGQVTIQPLAKTSRGRPSFREKALYIENLTPEEIIQRARKRKKTVSQILEKTNYAKILRRIGTPQGSPRLIIASPEYQKLHWISKKAILKALGFNRFKILSNQDIRKLINSDIAQGTSLRDREHTFQSHEGEPVYRLASSLARASKTELNAMLVKILERLILP